MAAPIDDKWFKQQQKRVGVTAEDIAARMGRDRSTLSHIYTGRIRMSLDWAQVFADVFDVPLAVIMEKAGVAAPHVAQQLNPGFSEGDVLPVAFKPGSADDREVKAAAEALGGRDGIDVWRVKGDAMAGAGLLDGDFILVDTHAAEKVRSGDTVVAQVYARSGAVKTVLRRWMPPVLLSVGGAGEATEVHVVDNDNVVIKGKVIACWRAFDTAA